MKIKLILLFALICVFTSISFGQTVKVTGKKVTYKRTGKDVPDHKKTFTLNYPKVAGVNGKKIEAILDYEKNFDFKIVEEQKELFGSDLLIMKLNITNLTFYKLICLSRVQVHIHQVQPSESLSIPKTELVLNRAMFSLI